MERLRVKFSRLEEVKFLSHLDLMRLWERAFRRAGFPLVYSEGFSPHPRISLAVPLQVGITSETEFMDVWLSNWLHPETFATSIRKQLPSGINIEEVKLYPEESASLQSQVNAAEYMVEIESDRTIDRVQSILRSLLEKTSIPWSHPQKEGVRQYDLRRLIFNLWLISYHDQIYKFGMNLRCDSTGTGRPEQVIKALGFTNFPTSMHRTNIMMS